MANTIKIKSGSGTPTTSDIQDKELAFDRSADKLYINDAGTIVDLTGSGATGDIEGVTAGTGLSGGGTSGTVTLNIDSTVATLTGSQTLTNKTIASPTFTGDIAFNDASTPVFTIKDTTNNVQADWRATDTLSVIGTTTDNAFYLKQNGAFVVNINSSQIILNSSGEDRNTIIKDDSGTAVFKVDAGTSKTEISTLLLDSVSVSGIQSSGESFADNDTSLMTSAAINDRIESFGYITTDTTLSTEQVQDIAGTMFSGNTEVGINVSYVDGDGTVDLVVDYLPATDDRDVKPSAITTSARKQVRAYFSTLGGLTGTADNNYQDLLVLSTYSDGTGGDVNALAFDKSEQKIRHYLADQADTTWGTAKVLAYEDTFSASTGLSLSGTAFSINFKDEDNMASNSASHAATQQSIKAYVDAEVAGIVNSAPAALNTLDELAAALGDDANFATTTSTALGNRLRVDTAAQGLTGTQQANAITNLGITATKAELNYVDGVTSNIQTQLNGKLSTSGTAANSTLLNNLGSGSFLRSDATSGTITSQDWNTYIDGTEAHFHSVTNHSGSNRPTGAYTYGVALSYSAASQGKFQLYAPETATSGSSTNQGLWYRSGWNTTYRQWAQIWDSTNDGSGSGLDADLLDGIQASGFTRAGVESGTPNTAANKTTFTCNDAMETSSGNQSGLQVWQDTAGADAFMTFHVAGDYAGYFGLDGSTNDLSWGGWSNGNGNKYRVFHAGNSTNITSVGTINTGTWNGSVIASAYLDSDTAHLSGSQTFSGAKTFSSDINLNAHLDMGDDDRIKLGASDDLQIVHTSNINFIHSTISDRDVYFRVNDGGTDRDAIIIDASENALVKTYANLQAGGDVIAYASSDKRLKDNLKPIENSLDKVSKLSGYEFDWNDKQETYQGKDVGVVAQEVEEVMPEIVTTRDNGYKAVKYEKLVPLLIECIKELKAEVEELKK